MLLVASHNPMTTNTPVLQGFSISNLTKMFKTFSNIYSDPYGAVAREKISNGFDADPTGVVTITMPSRLCPFLTISDRGPGMSQEFMSTHYCEVGYSTKDLDNLAIGGFGWGRLAALSICDTYTVTTQGRVYIVAKDEHGIPQISEAGESLEVGTHIRVPIPIDKLSTLTNKVQAFLKWVDPSRYVVIGATVEPLAVSLENENFALYLGNQHYTGALMGPVFYNIDHHKLGLSSDDKLPAQVVAKFPIGAIDLPPSRESVSYEPRTVEVIKAKYDVIREELPQLLSDTLRALPIFDRLELIFDISSMRWSHDRWMVSSGKRAEDKDVPYDKRKWGVFIEADLEKITFPLSGSQYSRGRRGHAGLSTKPSFSSTLSFTRRPTGVFYWNDVPNRVYDRIKSTTTACWVLHPSADVTTAEEASKLLDVTVIKLSDLPAPPTKVKSKNPPKILRNGSEYYDDLPDNAVWIASDECVPYGPRPTYLFSLSKAAQKYYLDETHERIDVWQKRQLDELKVHPGLKPYLAAKQVTMPYYWRSFLELNAHRFPDVQAELQGLKAALNFDPDNVLQFIDRPIVKPAKIPKTQKLIKTKKRLDAYLRGANGASRDGDIELFL